MAGSNDEMPPWLTPVDEIDGSGEVRIFSGNMKKIVIGVAIVVVAVFSVAMWMMYDKPTDDFAQPIEVAAASGPIRVKPAERGGKNIPDQDKEVFNRITGEGDEKVETSLGKEAEIPLSELPADEVKQEIREKTEPVVNKNENPVTSNDKKATLRSRLKPVAPKPISPMATLPTGKHAIQLGAYSSRDGAEAFWKKISAKYPNTFAGMIEDYVPLTRNGRTLYRLRAGPIKNRAEADRLCLRMKAAQNACMVVDPK